MLAKYRCLDNPSERLVLLIRHIVQAVLVLRLSVFLVALLIPP